MNLIDETQAAHDEFVRAIQSIALPVDEKLKAALAPALAAFHAKANEVDAYIQKIKADVQVELDALEAAKKAFEETKAAEEAPKPEVSPDA